MAILRYFNEQTQEWEEQSLGQQGPPGEQGPPGQSAYQLAVANNLVPPGVTELEWIENLASGQPGSGTGDMTQLVYDPDGISSNAFDLSNHYGILDGGVFT